MRLTRRWEDNTFAYTRIYTLLLGSLSDSTEEALDTHFTDSLEPLVLLLLLLMLVLLHSK